MITIILFFILAAYLYKKNDFVACMVAIIGVAVVLWLPLGGYSQVELVQEVQIMPIVETENTKNEKYVASSDQGIYAYRRVGEAKSKQGVLEVTSDYNTSVEIVAIGENEQPKMCKYVSKAKCGWFTFAFWTAKTKYVFYVPTGESTFK